MDNLNTISNQLIKFRDDRDWSKFHTPKNLIMALSGEVGELNSLVQWLEDTQILNGEIKPEVAKEMSDIFIYLLNLANRLDIDLLAAAQAKILDNEARYPVEKFKGVSTKSENL